MTQPIAQLLDQRIDLLPQRKKFQVHVLAVEFAAHAFIVNAVGYTGPRHVPADAAINFGTINYPQVHRGNDCIVEKDDRTGVWHATAYVPTNTCIPLTPANVPNVPLPSYTPPITIAPPPVISFPPVVLPPFVPPTSLPPITLPPGSGGGGGGGGKYDFGDWLPSVLAGITASSVGFESNLHTFTINQIACACVYSDCVLNIYLGTIYPAIVVTYNVDGTWTVEVHDPGNGGLVSTWTSDVTDHFAHTFDSGDLPYLFVDAAFYVMTTLTAGAIDVLNFFWSCGGLPT